MEQNKQRIIDYFNWLADFFNQLPFWIFDIISLLIFLSILATAVLALNRIFCLVQAWDWLIETKNSDIC